MAKNAGCMTTAEHYLCAYLMNAVINGNTDAVVQLNEVRANYNLKPIPDTDVNGKGGKRCHIHQPWQQDHQG